MKRTFKYLLACTMVAMAAWSCQEKEELKPDEPSDKNVELKAPVLSAGSETLEITEADLEQQILKLSWTDAVPEGNKVSLEYIVYANLASKDMYSNPETYSASSNLEYAFTGAALNELAGKLGVEEGAEAELQFSVYAKPQNSDVESVVSNLVKVRVRTCSAQIEIPETLYIVGSATSAGWDKSKGIPFSKGGDGLYRIEGLEINVVINDTGFKIYLANDGSSDSFFGQDLSSDIFGKAKLYGKEDEEAVNLFQPALMGGYDSGVYTVTFDAENLMMAMTRTGDIEYEVEFGEAVYPQGACFPWGWSFDGPMAKVADKVYEVKNVKCQWGSAGDSGFKLFIADGVWSPYFAQGEDAAKDNITIRLVTDSDVPQFYPGLLGYEDGIYDIRADFNAMKLELTFISGGNEGGGFDESAAIFLQGAAWEKGYPEWGFDRALALVPSEDGLYVSENPIYLNKWCYFKLVMKDWTEWVRDQSASDYWTATPRTKEPDNDCNFIPGNSDPAFIDGEYIVKFDRNTLRLSIEAVESDIDPATAIYLYGGNFINGSADWSFDDRNALVPVGDNVYKSPVPISLGEWTYFKFEKQDWTEWVPDKSAGDYWTVTPRTHDPEDNDGTFSIGNAGLKDGNYWVELDLNTNKVTVTAE